MTALLAGEGREDVAERFGIKPATLDRWRREFLKAGASALTPQAEPKQRWKRGGKGRKPKGRTTMLEQITVRCSKALRTKLDRQARKLSRERGERVTVPDVIRELLTDALG